MHTTFVFMRHAEGTHNVAAEKEGPSAYNDPLHEDAHITDRGIQQSKEVRPILEDPTVKYSAIYCSPSRRCRQTLGYAYPMGLFETVYIDDRLMEPQGYHICNKRAEYSVIQPECPAQWNLLHVGEENPYEGSHTDTAFRRRIFRFTAEVVATYPTGTVLIVGHHEWIRTWFDIFYRREVRLPNCGVICGHLSVADLSILPLLPKEPTVFFLGTVIRDVEYISEDIRIRALLAGLQRLHDDTTLRYATRIIAVLKKMFIAESCVSWDSIAEWGWKDIRILLQAFSAVQDEIYLLHEDDRVILFEAKEDLLRWCTDDIAN